MQDFSPNPLTPLALLKKQLHADGIHSFETIAEALHKQKQRQSQLGVYSQDRYTLEGSDCEATSFLPLPDNRSTVFCGASITTQD